MPKYFPVVDKRIFNSCSEVIIPPFYHFVNHYIFINGSRIENNLFFRFLPSTIVGGIFMSGLTEMLTYVTIEELCPRWYNNLELLEIYGNSGG